MLFVWILEYVLYFFERRKKMICRKATLKKQIMSLIMTVVMTTSVCADYSNIVYADDNVTTQTVTKEKGQVSISKTEGDIDLGVEEHMTGDLSDSQEEFDGADNAVSLDEFKEIVNEDNAVPKAGTANTLPEAVDNSTSIYFPEIGDQDHIGSCVAWSEVYYGLTYANCRAKNIPATGDNIKSPAFVYNQIKDSVGGTYPLAALEVLLTEGAPSKNNADFESYKTESLCRTWFPEKDIWLEAQKTRINSYAVIDSPDTISSNDDEDLNEMKELLNDGFLINCSTLANGWVGAKCDKSGSHAGELAVKNAIKQSGGHRMVIVGYDDNVCVDINGNGTIEPAEKGAFKVANSWGKDWGNNGFMWFTYDSLNDKSQAMRTYPDRYHSLYGFSVQYIADDEQNCSDVNLVMKLNLRARSHLRIYISAIDVDGNVITKDFTATNTYNVLGYSFNGKASADDGVMLFSLDNVIEGINADTVNDYIWSVKVEDICKDGYINILKDAYIEADGKTVFAFDSDEIGVDGTAAVKKWVCSKRINVNWDSLRDVSTVGVKRTIKADGVFDSSDDVTYKFVANVNGQTSILRDYSSSNECTFIPTQAGTYAVIVYANVNGKQIKGINTFEINEKPVIEKIQYSPSDYKGDLNGNYVGEKITLSPVMYGGTGDLKIDEIYVYGGNYEDGPHKTDLSLTDKYTATWTAKAEGDYTIYVKVKDAEGVTGEYTSEVITINPDRPMQITEFYNDAYSAADLFEEVKFSAKVVGGSGDYEYRFGIIHEDKEYEISNGYTDSCEVVKSLGIVGSEDGTTISTKLVGGNTIFVDARDKETNEVVRKTSKFKVLSMSTSYFEFNERDCFNSVGNI